MGVALTFALVENTSGRIFFLEIGEYNHSSQCNNTPDTWTYPRFSSHRLPVDSFHPPIEGDELHRTLLVATAVVLPFEGRNTVSSVASTQLRMGTTIR